MVSCQKGPTRHAYAWQIGPFWQDTLDISCAYIQHVQYIPWNMHMALLGIPSCIVLLWLYHCLLIHIIYHQGPLLLTWFNFNPSMDK